MKPADILTSLNAETLKRLLQYDPETGLFHWLVSNNQRGVGSQAGWLEEGTGYVRITVSGHRCMAHRLAWLYMPGRWPPDRIDHRDRNRSNNKWENLRSATDLENSGNKKVKKDNRLGVKGVELHVCGKYRARIFRNGKFIHLGLFDNIEQASAAYEAAAVETFGDFARSK